MTLALIALALCLVAGGLGELTVDKKERGVGIACGLLAAAFVGVVWLIVAHPVSSYNRENCRRYAEGYGLDPDKIDWSIRLGCRVTLNSGELVPESRIRITTEGHIVVVDDG